MRTSGRPPTTLNLWVHALKGESKRGAETRRPTWQRKCPEARSLQPPPTCGAACSATGGGPDQTPEGSRRAASVPPTDYDAICDAIASYAPAAVYGGHS